MDSEHRHELKTNELADWIVHLPGFLRRNWAQIVGLALIIVALLVIPVFKRTRHSATRTRQSESIPDWATSPAACPGQAALAWTPGVSRDRSLAQT